MACLYLFWGFVFGVYIDFSFLFNGQMLYTLYKLTELFIHLAVRIFLIF